MLSFVSPLSQNRSLSPYFLCRDSLSPCWCCCSKGENRLIQPACLQNSLICDGLCMNFSEQDQGPGELWEPRPPCSSFSPPASQVGTAPAALPGDGTDAEAPLSGAAAPVSPAVPVVSSSRGWAMGCRLACKGYRVPVCRCCCGVLEGDVVKFWFCNKSKHKSILSSMAGLPKGRVSGLARMGGLRAAARAPPRSWQQPFPGMGLLELQRHGSGRLRARPVSIQEGTEGVTLGTGKSLTM